MMLSQIPGLVQRTTPMVNGDGRRGVVSALTKNDWTIALDDIDEQPKHDTGVLPIVGWDVDIDHPTGAAHLAAWLTYKALRRTTAEHAENCAALGATPESYAAALDCALRCLPVDAAGVDLLRRYALRVGAPT